MSVLVLESSHAVSMNQRSVMFQRALVVKKRNSVLSSSRNVSV
jgi:hypothetical protein